MRIEITKKIDEYKRETWVFNMFEMNIVFITYFIEEKPLRKRLWRINYKWSKYSRRYENTIDEPKLNEHIKQEAINEAIKKLIVLTWDEWKK